MKPETKQKLKNALKAGGIAATGLGTIAAIKYGAQHLAHENDPEIYAPPDIKHSMPHPVTMALSGLAGVQTYNNYNALDKENKKNKK